MGKLRLTIHDWGYGTQPGPWRPPRAGPYALVSQRETVVTCIPGQGSRVCGEPQVAPGGWSVCGRAAQPGRGQCLQKVAQRGMRQPKAAQQIHSCVYGLLRRNQPGYPASSRGLHHHHMGLVSLSRPQAELPPCCLSGPLLGKTIPTPTLELSTVLLQGRKVFAWLNHHTESHVACVWGSQPSLWAWG